MTGTAFSPIATRGGQDLMEPFEIHRRAWLIVLMVVLPIVIAVGYGWLAYDQRDPLLAGVAGALVLLGLSFAPALRDVRAPLLVADEHGVRLQGPEGWVGLLWSEITSIAVAPHRGVRGPRLRLTADHLSDPYLVPLGLLTDVSAGQAEIALARRREAGRY